MEEERIEDLTKKIQEAIESESVSKFYANGFINAYHLADIIIIFKRNGKNEVAINMSYTTAKSFAEKINALITDFERRTEHEIMTIDTIKERLSKSE